MAYGLKSHARSVRFERGGVACLMRFRPIIASIAVGCAVVVGFAGCGDSKVTRDDAAPCLAVLKALDAIRKGPYDPVLEMQVGLLEALRDVRATCDPRTFPVAADDLGGENIPGMSELCGGDPYRESVLCAEFPQAASK